MAGSQGPMGAKFEMRPHNIVVWLCWPGRRVRLGCIDALGADILSHSVCLISHHGRNRNCAIF